MSAGTSVTVPRHVIGSTAVELCRSSRTGTPFSVRFSTRSGVVSTRREREPPSPSSSLAQGPSCIFVGPIESASKETLEALYRQVFALASIWLLILGFGSSVCLIPIVYTIGQAYQDAFNSGFSYSSQASALEFLSTLNGILFIVLGSVIGYPIASASVGALRGLWRNDLVALKGSCPNCGEEVFAFVRSDQSNKSPQKADCHVCECSLEFRTKVEQSLSSLGRQWVYGRIYLIRRRGRRQRCI